MHDYQLITFILSEWNEILNKNAMMNIFDTCNDLVNSSMYYNQSLDINNSINLDDEPEEVFAI